MRMIAVIVMAALSGAAQANPGTYLAPEEFVRQAFGGHAPKARALWLTAPLTDELTEALGHPPGMLRVRYWAKGGVSAWILDEIGKERPITTGVVVADGAIRDVEVLVYRESRGWEVRHSFFTDQFRGTTLDDDGDLSQRIDGITGATLSVRALKRIARAALVLDEYRRRGSATAAGGRD